MGAFRTDADRLIDEHPELFDDQGVHSKPKRKPEAKKQSSARLSRRSKPLPAEEVPVRSRAAKRRGIRPFFAWAGITLFCIPIGLGGAAAGGLCGYLRHTPAIAEFDAYDPPEATLIHDGTGASLAALYEQRRFVVPIGDMPGDLVHAFVAIEDMRFYQHLGVDPLGVARAVVINAVRGRASQGASTITQQTARNLLTRVGSEKTLDRKLREMLVALRMEAEYSKDQILEVYLNQIYLGSGTYGVEAAARTYFGKSVGDLNLQECATLAGLPQLPERYSPLNNPDLAKKRRNQVLMRMWEQGFVGDDAFDKAVVAPLDVNPERLSRTRAPYFVDAVRRDLSNESNLDATRLQTAGWEIDTSIDPKVQQIAEDTLRRGLDGEEKNWTEARQERYREAQSEPEFEAAPATGQIRMARVVRIYSQSVVVELPGGWRSDAPIPAGSASYFEDGKTLSPGEGIDIVVEDVEPARGTFRARILPEQRLQGAIVCLDAQTGEVRALVGGRDYYDRDNNGFFNRAVLARRQAGSTLKPLYFSAALESGLTPWSTFVDRPITFADGYTPHNYENRHFGVTTLQTALEHSRNIPTILLAQEVGIDNCLQFVARFNRLNGDWRLPRELPVVLGTTGVTPLELAAAYQPLANQGVAVGPTIVNAVRFHDGRDAVTLEPAPTKRLLTPQTSAYLLQMMMGVMTEGTGKEIRDALPEGLRNEVAGKTGTTNDNRDAWFAGFTPTHVVVVWVGFDQNVPLGPGRTGGRVAGPIWADFVSQLWSGESPDRQQLQLTPPADFVLVAVNPADDSILQAGQSGWQDPPHWRVISTEEYRTRTGMLAAAE